MTRSSDLVMVEREVLEAAKRRCQHYLDRLEFRPTGRDPKNTGFNFAAVPEWALRQELTRIELALQSVEGGVQGSIATKQESRPESAPRTETATAIYSALSSACIEHSALSVSGFNLFGDSKSIKAAQEWLHSHSQIGDLKTNLRHWRDECGKLHAQLTKTPSADHDAGNLRATGGEA